MALEAFMEKRELVTEKIDGERVVVDTIFIGKEWVEFPPKYDGFGYYPCDETKFRMA